MYLVTYDISKDKLRTKLAKKLLNYGKRVQYSVFECELDNSRYKKMYSEIVKLTFNEEVSVRIYIIDEGAKRKIQVIGNQDYDKTPKKDDVIFI